MAPAHIALFTVTLDNVGPARALLTLAERLDRARFQPHVITALPIDRAAAAQLGALDVPCAALGTGGPLDLRTWWRLAGQLRRWRIDLVHARLPRAGFFARVAAPFAGRPVVLVNVVNMYRHHFAAQHGPRLAAPLLWAERRSRSLVDVWVANSTAAARELESVVGVPAGNVRVVANAIDPDAFVLPTGTRERVRSELGLASEDRLIGAVARLVPLKRLELLLDAAARVVRDLRAARLLIVGDGPARATLQERARQLGLPATFTGNRADVPDLLAAMDVFAFCSASEGQPNVVLEAMAAGLPVVAVDIPGLDEIVLRGQTGELVGETAEALGDALVRVLSDPAHSARLGAAGRARAVTAFSPGRMVREFEAIYQRALVARAA